MGARRNIKKIVVGEPVEGRGERSLWRAACSREYIFSGTLQE
jgi:hypothetical protein